ncbi:hypothetical protein K2Y00_03650 [Patescibacteria group bacterium]|nr:hypothetical protein [Patescibacteria group bacterium]
MTRTRIIVLTVLIIIILGVLGYLGLMFFGYQRAENALPEQGSEILFVDRGVGERYVMEGKALVLAMPEPLPDGIVVHESVPSPLVAGESVILATAPGVPGMIAGIAHTDGDVTLLAAGGTSKSNLLVREDGRAIFVTNPSVVIEEASAGEEGAEDTVEETGSASEPSSPALAAQAPASTPSQLISVHIGTGTITALGVGHGPRLLADGSILALSKQGVVKINPVTGDRSLILPYESTDTPAGGISPSGTVVALSGADVGQLEFYRINPSGAAAPVHLGFVEFEGDITRVAFTDDEHLFLRTNVQVARLYQIPTESLPVATPLAILLVAQPE